MKKNNQEQISNLIQKVHDLKDELELLLERKDKIKLELYFDAENEDLAKELEEIKNRNIQINEQITELNNQLFVLLKDGGE